MVGAKNDQGFAERIDKHDAFFFSSSQVSDYMKLLGTLKCRKCKKPSISSSMLGLCG